MINLIKSNAIVTALVVVALLVVYQRIVSPLIADSGFEDDPAVLVDDIDDVINGYAASTAGAVSDLEFVTAQYDIGHFKTTDLHWNEKPTRDPFAPLVQIDSDDVDAVLQKVQEPTREPGRVAAVTLPVVNAIVNSERYRYAVIDGEIMAVGDRLGNFQVEQINRRTVSLKLSGNNQLVNVTVTE